MCSNAAGQALNAENGVVESLHPYMPNQFCYYEVNTGREAGGPTRIRFTKFDVEDEDPSDNYNKNDDVTHHTHHCEWDYVKIDWKDTDTNAANTTGYFCQMVDRDSAYFSTEDSFTNIKDYDGNDPVDSGYYQKWNEINTNKFRITLKSDKSRQSYGFRLEWQSNSTSHCAHTKCSENEECESFTGLCKCKRDYRRDGAECRPLTWATWGEWAACSSFDADIDGYAIRKRVCNDNKEPRANSANCKRCYRFNNRA